MQVVKPVRVERTYTQKLAGKPDDVFHLLCPVREKEWVDGWDPFHVYTLSGFAEDNCIFITGEKNPESIWVITRFDVKRHELEIVKVTPGMTVGKIRISLAENKTGGTDAEVVYMYTAISAEGEKFVQDYSEDFFKMFMQFSESALNSYLEKHR